MENQSQWLDDYLGYREKFLKERPGMAAVLDDLREEVYKDGALSGKVKRLMAMTAALRAGCRPCIIGQAKMAISAGATKDEVLEAISVAIAMGGTPALGWSWRVVKLLEEEGLL